MDKSEQRSTKPTLFQEILAEFPHVWRAIPYKGLFIGFFLAWAALFHFFGTSIHGYSNSLYSFIKIAYAGPDDSHGYIIPLAVLALFWWKRNDLKVLPARLWMPGLAFLALAIFLHIAGYLVQQPRVSLMALFF